jgi:hypothetical protein
MLHACIKPVKAIKSPPLFFLFYFFPSFEGDERIFKSLFGIIIVSLILLIFQSIFYLKKLFKTKKIQKFSIPFLNHHPIVINESFIALPCSLTLFPALRLT